VRSTPVADIGRQEMHMNQTFGFPGDFLAEFDQLQRMVEQAFGAPGAAAIRAGQRGAFPAINIGTTPETIEVLAFAPGIDPASLELMIDKGVLTIAGERKAAVPDGGKRTNVYARERFHGPFRRVISLPEDADPTKVEANYRDGLLRVSVSKRESSRPRRIDIK
jgi:HSP20 family protein